MRLEGGDHIVAFVTASPLFTHVKTAQHGNDLDEHCAALIIQILIAMKVLYWAPAQCSIDVLIAHIFCAMWRILMFFFVAF